jgi:hypothetical protein
MITIAVRPTKRFGGAWEAYEAPGVQPAFTGPQTREYALSYARGRFGARAGEIHLYDSIGAAIEETIMMDDRPRR